MAWTTAAVYETASSTVYYLLYLVRLSYLILTGQLLARLLGMILNLTFRGLAKTIMISDHDPDSRAQLEKICSNSNVYGSTFVYGQRTRHQSHLEHFISTRSHTSVSDTDVCR